MMGCRRAFARWWGPRNLASGRCLLSLVREGLSELVLLLGCDAACVVRDCDAGCCQYLVGGQDFREAMCQGSNMLTDRARIAPNNRPRGARSAKTQRVVQRSLQEGAQNMRR